MEQGRDECAKMLQYCGRVNTAIYSCRPVAITIISDINDDVM